MTALVPVEGNPFAPKAAGLIPVAGNPFEKEPDHRAMQERLEHGEIAERLMAETGSVPGPLARLLKNAGSSAVEGFGDEHLGFEPGSEAEHFFQKTGLLQGGRGGAFTPLTDPVLRAGTAGADAFMRAFKGAVFAGAGGVEQIIKETGGDAQGVKRELIDIGMNVPQMMGVAGANPSAFQPKGPLSRVRMAEDGTPRAEPIGAPPKAVDFEAAGAVIAEQGKAAAVEGPAPGMVRESAGPANVPAKLRSLYEEEGIHPAEVLADAAQDPALAKRLASDDPMLPAEYTGVDPDGLKAAQAMAEDTGLRSETIREMPGVSPELSTALQRRLVWPETPVGEAPGAPKVVRMGDHVGNLIDKIGFGDIVSDIQMKTTPMAERNASMRARAAAKDWANTMRVSDFDVQSVIKGLTNEFKATPERLTEMWNAADLRGTKLRSGDRTAKLEGLTDAERNIVEGLQERLKERWGEAIIEGVLPENAKGLESYAPRIVAGGAKKGEGFATLDPRGRDLTVSSSLLNHRKHLTVEETEAAAKKALGDSAFVVRDIRTLAIAEASLTRAIAGRRLLNQIKEMGEQSGAPTVFEGIPKKGDGTFAIEQHPVFYKSVKRNGVIDQEGNAVYDRVPIRVSNEFEGPLRAILQGDDGALYTAAMEAKSKSMNYIMFSPMAHNMVIYGRAFPEAVKHPLASGVSVKWYTDGYRIRNSQQELYRDFIQNGLVPVSRGFIDDVSAVRAGESVVPQYSMEARIAGAIPGFFSERAGTAVKAAVDGMANVLHNTLLWDRIADMQAGMAKMQYDLLIKDGIEHGVAMKTASHWANRLAGALPVEEMSEMARKTSNIMMFSRSFTLGNLGSMKDMFNGLPRSVLAQIERDHGIQSLDQIQSKAQRKAIGINATDLGLFYAGNSVIQSALMAIRGEDDEGYVKRFQAAIQRVATSPLEALNPLAFLGGLTPNHANEPGKEDRILWGYDSQGTAQYIKNPFGKVTEDQIGWLSHPFKMLDNKLSPMTKPLKEIQANQDFAGRHIYNPYPNTPEEYLANVAKAVMHVISAQGPKDTLATGWELLTDKNLTPDQKSLDTSKLVGQLAGFMFSSGAQGGPAMGEVFRQKAEQKYAWEQNAQSIRKAIKEGRTDEAVAKMTEIKIDPHLQQFLITTTMNPSAGIARKAAQKLMNDMPAERRERIEADLQRNKPQ